MARQDLLIHPDQPPRIVALEGLRVREDVLFTDYRGRGNKGIRRQAEKALGKLRDPLQKMLEPDEVVLSVARACAPVSVIEQLTFGWYAYRISATSLVFTNRRLLLFRIRNNGDWTRSSRSVFWGDVAEASVEGLFTRVVQIKYRDGKKEKYWNMWRADANKAKSLLPALLRESAGENTAAQGVISLCPECGAGLTAGAYHCIHCGLVFKDEKTMVRRSLVLPGGGYFYCGQTFLGIGDSLGELVLLFWCVMAMLGVFGVIDLAEPGEPPGDRTAALILFAFFGFLLVVEKLLTIHHCRRFIREFIPTAEHRAGIAGTAVGSGSF